MHLTQVIMFLKQVDELETAKTLLDTFTKYSHSLQQYDELGMLYEKCKFYNESLKMLEKCYSSAYEPGQLKSIRANFAKVYNHLNDPDKSLFYSNLNLEMNPSDPEALMEQSFSYYLKAEFLKSRQIQEELLKMPNVSDDVKNRITFNMGSFEMEDGNFKSGLYKMILGGKKIGLWAPIKTNYPKWQGEQTDKTVLVYAEGGIGDELLNIRFMKEFEKRNINAIWVGHREDTNKLFKRHGFRVMSINDSLDPLEQYLSCDGMTMPILMNIEKENFWKGSYLKPDPEYIEKWKKILPQRFLTVRWSGNPYYDQDLHRSVDKDLLVSELEKLNIPLVSLQIDNKYCMKQLIDVDVASWEDTLAIQYLAKGNITSCTSTAHSAGSIEAKSYVLPPICTYYPWLGRPEENRSWWYSENTNVYVQKKHKSWAEPINNLIGQLKRDLADDN